jgi:hypothetical protein
MNKVNYKIKVVGIIAVLGASTMLALAVKFVKRNQQMAVKKTVHPLVKLKQLVYDPALLRKFEKLAGEFDFNKTLCTYAGVINIEDGKDSTNSVRGLEFLFSKVNKDFYYRLGKTETIHQNGLNVFIQHEQDKVVLSNPNVVMKSPVNNVQLLQKNLRSEGYELHTSVSGNNRTLSLINDTHITCKEFSVSYDTVSDKLVRIYTRLSDFGDPLNKKKDRVIEINISTLQDKASLGRYPLLNDVLYKAGGKWKLTAKYAKNELIIM